MTQNSSNESFTNNADGFTSGGGTTQRTLTVTGGNATITGSGAAVITLPTTTSTLYGTATGSITSAQLATSLSDETGTGAAVFAASPTLTTATISNSAVTGSSLSGDTVASTGLGYSGSTSGVTTVTAPAVAGGTLTLPTATDTLVGRATTDTLTNKTLTSPTLTTPALGVATATSVNKVALTAPATSATLTIADGKTFTALHTMTIDGTDATTMTFPTSSDTVAGLAAVQTITGAWSFNDAKLVLKGVTSGTTTLKSGGTAGSSVVTLPVATDTLVGKATTDTLTNKTLSTGSVIDANVTVTEVLAKVYPVGSIYIATVITNPATLFGFGTWAAYAAGRTLIGVGTSDQAFAAATTGGESNHTLTQAEIASHSHAQSVDSSYNAAGGGTAGRYATNNTGANWSTGASGPTAATGGGGAHNNLQPYIVTYMWTRTA